MERSEVVELVRRFYECASLDDVEGAVALLDDSFVLHDMGEDIVGRDEMREYMRTFTEAFPEMVIRPEGELVVEADRVALCWVARGRHEGTLLGIEPTHRDVEVRGVEISVVRDGRFIETTQTWDALGLFQQLGAMPSDAEALTMA